MMKRYVLHIIAAADLVLALILAALWFTPNASLRNAHWTPPAPPTTDFAGMVPALPGVASADTSQFIAMLERPLFTPTRRPPPPPPPPQAEAPADNFSTAKLSGTYAGNGLGGAIISIAGKSRRVQLNQAVEGWVLKSVQGRSVTFARGGETRTLQLPKAVLTAYTGLPQGSPGPTPPVAVGGVGMPAPAAAHPPTQGGAGDARPAAPRATFGGRR